MWSLERTGRHVRAAGSSWGAPAQPRALDFVGVLREAQHQPEAVERTVAKLEAEGGGVLVLPCGFGKTTVALKISSRLGGRVLILVHKSVLLTQWRERIEQFLPGATVGVLQGAKMEADESRDIVIGMLQSVHQRGAEYKDMLVGFNLLIVDEAHRVPAATFFAAVSSVSARYTLGLTAPRRRRAHETLYAALGNVAFQVERPPTTQAGLHPPHQWLRECPGEAIVRQRHRQFQQTHHRPGQGQTEDRRDCA